MTQPTTQQQDPRAAQIAAAVAAGMAAQAGVSAGARTAAAPVLVGGEQAVAMATAAAEATMRAIAAGLDAWLAQRKTTLTQLIIDIAGEESDGGPEGVRDSPEVLDYVQEEQAREDLFAAGSRARLARDLPEAMQATGEERRSRVQKLLERERRFADQRMAAIEERVAAVRERAQVRKESATGAYWELDERLDNCKRCVAMSGQAWPWSVLRIYHPPLHQRCGCRLRPLQWAIDRGLITAGDVRAFSDVPRDLLQEADAEWFTSALDLMEARHAERWGAWGDHPGRFKPAVTQPTRAGRGVDPAESDAEPPPAPSGAEPDDSPGEPPESPETAGAAPEAEGTAPDALVAESASVADDDTDGASLAMTVWGEPGTTDPTLFDDPGPLLLPPATT